MIVTNEREVMSKEAGSIVLELPAGLRKTTRNLVMIVALEPVVYTCNRACRTRK